MPVLFCRLLFQAAFADSASVRPRPEGSLKARLPHKETP